MAFLQKMDTPLFRRPAHTFGQPLENLAFLVAEAALRTIVEVLSEEAAVILVAIAAGSIGEPGAKKQLMAKLSTCICS